MIIAALDQLCDIPGRYHLFGFPCDTLAHIVVGFFIYFVIARWQKSRALALAAIVIIELFKALVVSLPTTLFAKHYVHAAVEVLATFVGAGLADQFIKRWRRKKRT